MFLFVSFLAVTDMLIYDLFFLLTLDNNCLIPNGQIQQEKYVYREILKTGILKFREALTITYS